MISSHISDDIPLQKKIFNMVILILNSNALLHFCLIGALQAVRHQTKCDVINEVKLFPTVYPRYTVANF